jgi:AraC-like DNA-binding protein
MRRFAPSLLSTQITEATYYCPDRPRKRPALEIVCAGREDCRPDYVITRRNFPWMAIELVVRGEGWLKLNGRRLRLSVGTFFCYGPGVAYSMTTEPARPMVKYFVDFAGPEARKLLALIPLRPGQVRHALYPLELQEILNHLIVEGNRRSKLSEAIALNYLRLFLQKLPECVEHSSHQNTSQALEFYLKAKAFFDKNYESLPTAEAAAAKLGVTPETLCRVFQRFANTTPYQHLLRLKINRAVDLLLGTNLLTKEVGYRLGFGDQFHFSRVFKRLQGTSPNNFRQLRGRAA